MFSSCLVHHFGRPRSDGGSWWISHEGTRKMVQFASGNDTLQNSCWQYEGIDVYFSPAVATRTLYALYEALVNMNMKHHFPGDVTHA